MNKSVSKNTLNTVGSLSTPAMDDINIYPVGKAEIKLQMLKE